MDGLCKLDVGLRPGILSAHATSAEFRVAAGSILERCVGGEPSQGGVATGIGMKCDLMVNIRTLAS